MTHFDTLKVPIVSSILYVPFALMSHAFVSHDARCLRRTKTTIRVCALSVIEPTVR